MISRGDGHLPELSASERWRSGLASLRCLLTARRSAAIRVVLALTAVIGLMAAISAPARAETRSLKLYFVHTGERANITFKRNGKYDADGLAKLNRFLRDWRRNEPTKMDPRLFDLIWNVYRNSGSSDYINVLGGYRAPTTNEMLRTRSSRTGVAKNSQHILGRAMDFYIPGVPLEKLREIGLKLQMGGVGYYPTSGSPFVHMDVGGVRAWPRASREVLARLFPDGKTIHLPPDGKPLPGYQAALADYKRRMNTGNIEIASSGTKRKSFFAALFGGGGDEDEDSNAITADEGAPASAPQKAAPQVQVASAAPPRQTVIENLPGVQTGLSAPVPAERPTFKVTPQPAPAVETALVSSPARESANAAIASVMQDDGSQNEQFADLQKYKIPVPELLGDRKLPGEAEVDVAAVPLPGARPDYQVAAVIPDLDRPEAIAPAPEARPQQGRDELAALLQRMAADGELDAQADDGAKGKTTTVASAMLPPAVGSQLLTRSLADSVKRRFQTGASAPRKGGRPSPALAAAASRAAGAAGPKLTDKLIAQWVAGRRPAALSRPTSGDTYTSRSLTAGATGVYTAGYSGRPVQIDPARFSGGANVSVNVEKFR